MTGFTYTYSHLFTSHTTAITLLQIKAPANDTLEILRASLTQRSVQADDNFDVSLLEKTVAATVTAASAGDPSNHVIGAANSKVQVGTAATGHTGSAEGTDGNIVPREGVSVLAGWQWIPTPEERIYLGGGKIIALKLNQTVTSIDLIASITYRELS